MNTLTLYSKVAGVTFEGRQDIIGMMHGNELCQLRPEPENPYDPNAIAVWVAFPPESKMLPAQIGYLPRDLAATVAPKLDNENLICEVIEITGGFLKNDGSMASYGVRIKCDIPVGENEPNIPA